MSIYLVASVPYVNAYPLVRDLLQDPEKTVEVQFAFPSELPALLDSGAVSAILVSSIDALQTPGRRVARTACVGSFGPVESVRLFSKVPFARIQTLALDAASMTSNHLAQVLLNDMYGIRPTVRTYPSVQAQMLADCDACVLIGDVGMMASDEGLEVLDLGQAWTDLTKLPFMWAAWIGGADLTPALAAYLSAPPAFCDSFPRAFTTTFRLMEGMTTQLLWDRNAYEMERREIYQEVSQRWKWPVEVAEHYLGTVMHYALSDPMLEGYREFQRRLIANGFSRCEHFPMFVEPEFGEPEIDPSEFTSQG